jgi:hypothetical protein
MTIFGARSNNKTNTGLREGEGGTRGRGEVRCSIGVNADINSRDIISYLRTCANGGSCFKSSGYIITDYGHATVSSPAVLKGEGFKFLNSIILSTWAK